MLECNIHSVCIFLSHELKDEINVDDSVSRQYSH